MKTFVYDDYKELSVNTAEMIAAVISEKPEALLCFPAGETSVGTFSELIKLNKSGKISFSKAKIVGLDEWAALGEMKSENCFSFLKKHFFDHIDYRSENLCFFDGEADDLSAECARTDSFIQLHGPIDMVLLGVGMNGHFGLNEPGSSFDLYSHIVELDETTRKVGQKYFTGPVKLTKGITLGIRYFMEAVTLIVQLNGAKKAEVAGLMQDGPVSNLFPASSVRLHRNSYLLMDKSAAGR